MKDMMPGMLTLTNIVMVVQWTMVKTNYNLVSVNFNNLTLELNWGDQERDLAHLVDFGDCIYDGHLVRDNLSRVLVTGCQNDSLGVQIHSDLVGDWIFSLENGSIDKIEFAEEDFYCDVCVDEPKDRLRQHKRGADEYDYEDHEPIENPELTKYLDYDDGLQFEIDGENIEMPKELILNINVYLDTNWYENFGNRLSVPKASRILKQAARLFQHKSLDTKIDLQHGGRIYKSTAPHLKANKQGYDEFGKHLKKPFMEEGGQKVAHLHMTADAEGSKSKFIGKSKRGAILSKNPRAVIKQTRTEIRTSMTVAHELAHLLGMQHDFSPVDGLRGTCGTGKGDGGTVMNYGDMRLRWSECSNQDFSFLYTKVVQIVGEGNFVLKSPEDLAKNGRY